MPAPTATAPARLSSRGGLLLRVVAALALGVSGYLHLVLAQGPLVSGGQVTLAGLFIAQGLVAALVAVWLLVRAGPLAWVAAGVVGLVSLLALVSSVYVQSPAIGPFPVLYEPFWYEEKVLAAVSAGLAAAAALTALSGRWARGAR